MLTRSLWALAGALALALAAVSVVRALQKPQHVQDEAVTASQVAALRPGMSSDGVRARLGWPADTFVLHARHASLQCWRYASGYVVGGVLDSAPYTGFRLCFVGGQLVSATNLSDHASLLR